MTSVDAKAAPATTGRQFGSGFWTVAYALLIIMAIATLPSPLYGLYRTRDHLSSFMITVVFAIFAGGTIAALLAVPSIAARIGRRGVMIGAVAIMMVAAGLLAAWKALPALFIGRLLSGTAVGLAAGTAITYLIELNVRAGPPASPVRARNVGTSVTVGGLGLGPLIAGALAQWAKWPLTLPYLVWLALGTIALVGLAFVPETGRPTPRTATTLNHPTTDQPPATDQPTSKRSARLPIPAAAGTLSAYAASGLFAGLAGLFLSTTLHHPSHALSGATLFLVFSSGVVAEIATARLAPSRVLAIGTFSMLAGLVLLVVSVRLHTPSLAMFLIGGALIGAGLGAVFKGTTGIVLGSAAPEDRLALTSDLLVALYIGLSVPVVGAGIALRQGASPPNTVLGFAILVALGVSVSGWLLLRRGRQ